MFIDTVQWNPQTALIIAETAVRFGFTGLVFNVNIEGAGKNAKQVPPCPIKRIEVKLPNAQSCVRTRKTEFTDLGLLSTGSGSDSDGLLQITRATVMLTDPNQLGFLNFLSRSNQFDIVAVEPADNRSWLAILAQGEFDVVRVDLCSIRNGFSMKRHHLMQLVRRGICFEICFNLALRDSTARSNMFAAAQQIVRFVPHDKIFLSSGATQPLELRSPHDVANIAMLLGIRGSPKDVMGENASHCIYRAAARRTGGGMVGLAGQDTEFQE